jgi:transposase
VQALDLRERWKFRLELSSVCVNDAEGKFVKETKVASDLDALALFFKGRVFDIERTGI